MQIKPIALAKGMATFIPGVAALACGGSGGTDSSRYCYAVWLRHLMKLAEAGIDTGFADVAELGPGDSLGVGLCAVLTGADRYFAFDAKAHAHKETNLQTLGRLVELLARQEEIGADAERATSFYSFYYVIYRCLPFFVAVNGAAWLLARTKRSLRQVTPIPALAGR